MKGDPISPTTLPEAGPPSAPSTGYVALPPLEGDLKWILERISLQTAGIGRRLDELGLYKVPRRIEEEQAAALHWMLNLYFKHGNGWREIGDAILKGETPHNESS